MDKVRTRFAPSPTGHLHIGNARTALMNYVFSKSTNGSFILRVEDTDVERSTQESEQKILQDLVWLGLKWDEGPDKQGEYGPYRQSERLEIYREYAERLLKEGKAYHCFCTAEELEQRRDERIKRGEPAAYDGRCRNLTEDQKNAFLKEGRKPVIRFKVEDERVSFFDEIKGEITFPNNQIGDFVIVRANGMPMYNFSCAVDDHLMEITHVIRGDDHVSNTPRQVLLYKAFGWSIPKFIHTPMILGADGSRLSKRHGATSVAQYRDRGFLPEALVNFLSLLAWSPDSGEEILLMPELINSFDIKRISHSAAVFDNEKLKWMNGVHIRNLSPEDLSERVLPFFIKKGYNVKNPEDIKEIVKTLQERSETLSDMADNAEFFFAEKIYPEAEEEKNIILQPESARVLEEFAEQVSNTDSWDSQEFLKIMKQVSKSTGVKGKNLWMPVRIALSGQSHGPELTSIVEIFGKEKCVHLVNELLREFHNKE